MRKLQPDNLYVKSLRYLGVGNWQMRFIQVHVTSLHPLYLRSCGDSVLAIIPERISRVVLAIEIAALSKVILLGFVVDCDAEITEGLLTARLFYRVVLPALLRWGWTDLGLSQSHLERR